jgi:hypothetical protein
MKNNLKKLMEDIAGKRLEREMRYKDPGWIRQQLEEKDKNIEKFNHLKKEVIIPFVRELNEIFRHTADQFTEFSDETATAREDKSRTFCQVFYFPKDRPREKAGLNTASILFECTPTQGEIRISSNIYMRPAALKEKKVVKISEFDEKIIESELSTFVSEVTNKLTD